MSVLLDDIKHLQFEPMKNHTTFRIGGPAKHFYMPASVEELILVIEACRKSNEKYMILGNGSNVLFMDQGYDGVIIQIYSNMNSIKIEDDVIYAEAGALLSKVASFARDNELTGMEFAAGIPGTLGGAVVMNAGAYGGEMKDIIEYVDILEEDLTVKRYLCDEMEFGYRHSIVEGSKVVLGAAIKLDKGDVESINKKMAELKEARVSKQPLEYPSAGSTFKRPEGYFAGKLIEDSGLKGYSVGGAMVSTKHSGFVINYDNATSSDVLTLISDVQNVVYDKYGVKLEPEVRIIT
ncbi:MAG: UDP-N-acetylmuramate dehydrogenase [Lachnospiraceae bacterium]|nr:UDP-N-acetylmuramate dehydrogenase [Lachnospiraceae bacterium]